MSPCSSQHPWGTGKSHQLESQASLMAVPLTELAGQQGCAGASMGHPAMGTPTCFWFFQEEWAASSHVILALIPAAGQIYGSRRPLQSHQ